MSSIRMLGVLLVLGTVACHRPSLRHRGSALGSRFGALGHKVAIVVKPALPTVDVRGLATDLARAKVADAVAAHGQINLQHTVVVGGSAGGASAPVSAPQPQPQPQPTAGDAGGATPDVTVHHTQAPATVFALRAQTNGGKSTCTSYPTMEECTQTCTNMLRAASMNPNLRNDPNATKSCSCLEQDGRC